MKAHPDGESPGVITIKEGINYMAKSGAQAAASNQETELPKPIDLAGFDDVGRPDIDGWFKAAEEFVIYGRICGFFAFKQVVRDKNAPDGVRVQTREALCIRLGQDTKLYKKGDENGFMGTKGQVGAISMMYALEDVRQYVEKRGVVYIKFTKKVSIGGGQTVWKAIVKAKGEKTAPVKAVMVETPASAAPVGDSSGGDDEIPF